MVLQIFLNSLIVFFPFCVSSQDKSTQFSGLTALSSSGRSLMWPKQAATSHCCSGKFLSKYSVILVAFAPDSTMTKFFILFLIWSTFYSFVKKTKFLEPFLKASYLDICIQYKAELNLLNLLIFPLRHLRSLLRLKLLKLIFPV